MQSLLVYVVYCIIMDMDTHNDTTDKYTITKSSNSLRFAFCIDQHK